MSAFLRQMRNGARPDLLALGPGTIAVTIDCHLADLTDAALAAYGYRRGEVIDTTAQEYPVTRRWAQYTWAATTCTGLFWNSRRSHHRLSFMLFVNLPRALTGDARSSAGSTLTSSPLRCLSMTARAWLPS